MTKSSRSESHLALGLQNLRAFANSGGHVPQCPMPDDVTGYIHIIIITGSTVVLTCCKGDSSSQWETPFSDPHRPKTP